jgi:hypothetical protein
VPLHCPTHRLPDGFAGFLGNLLHGSSSIAARRRRGCVSTRDSHIVRRRRPYARNPSSHEALVMDTKSHSEEAPLHPSHRERLFDAAALRRGQLQPDAEQGPEEGAAEAAAENPSRAAEKEIGRG